MKADVVRRALGREAVWVAVLLVCAGVWGARYVQQWRDAGRPQAFYQQYFEPAVMVACGRGFAVAQPTHRAVEDFLEQRTDRVDCGWLGPDHPVVSEGLYQYAWFYLMWMVGAYWKVAGVSWSGLVPLFGALFALVIGLAYAVFRLAVPPWVAWVAAAALMVSPLHLQNLPHLRDYAKAPFVIGLLLILFCIVKRPTPRRVLALSALYGFVLGIGYGFRTDLLASIPPLALTVLLFVPGFGLRGLGSKLAALALAAVLFVGASWPVTSYVAEQGGCQWHVVLAGLDREFTRDLGIAPSYYQWISLLSDEYIHTSVNGFLYRTEGAAPVEYCSATYDAASGKYLLAIAAGFPADALTRAYASTLRVMDLPFYLWTAEPGVERSRIGQVLTNFAGGARVSTALAVVLLGAWSWRLGLFALAVVLYFGAYPALQFGQRHFFHLEFIGWWAMAFVGWQAVRFIRWKTGRGEPPSECLAGSGRRGLQFVAVTLAVLMLPVPAARAYQDARVAELRGQLFDAPRALVDMAPDETGALHLGEDQSLGERGDETRTAYLDIRLDLTACPSGVPLSVRYAAANPLFDFSTLVHAQPDGSVPERILLPVYRGFTGLSVDGSPPGCVSSVERLESLDGLALLPVLTLPRDWQALPAHQRVGGLALRFGWYGR